MTDYPNLSDTEREALVWKIAADAESQFWKKLSTPIVRGLSIIAIMLAILGVSAYTIIPGWIDEQVEIAIKTAIVNELALYSKEADKISHKTLQSLSDTRESASKVRELAKTLVEGEQKHLQEMVDNQRTEVDKLRKKTDDLKRKAESLKSLAEIEDVEPLAKKVSEIARIADDVGVAKLTELTAQIASANAQIAALKDAQSRSSQIGVTKGNGLEVTLEQGQGHTLFFLIPNSTAKGSKLSIGPGRIASVAVRLIRKGATKEEDLTLAESECTHNDRTYIADLPGVCIGYDRAQRDQNVVYEAELVGLEGSRGSLENVDLVAIHLPVK